MNAPGTIAKHRRSRTPAPRPENSALVPLATYRLQLQKDFPFAAAQKIIPYLKNLGISDIYLSPIMTARRGSPHGYDTINHNEINPELGGEEAFARFSQEASAKGLHLLVDVVPNHMCITDTGNSFWMDVLENGPASPYAKYFDVTWNPTKKELANRVLLPFLGDQYGKVLEAGEIRLVFDNAFWVTFGEWKLPVSPRSWAVILTSVLKTFSERHEARDPARLELESILNGLNYLPFENETSPDRIKERQREKEILKKRLAQLVDSSPDIADAMRIELDLINGQKGQPRSFDRLEELLDKQVYRLCDWKVAADEINYRRFFDINDLAAIRVEEEDVFHEVHRAVFDWVAKGRVTGLRVDHVDGLLDPLNYLERIQAQRPTKRPIYVVVEKILSRKEVLDRRWPVSGTTGYDFINQMNGLFVSSPNGLAMERIYRKFTHRPETFTDVVVTCKKMIMLVAMASELRMLSTFLDGISEQHRWSRDFTQWSLQFALREVVSCFPVYRSYIRSEQAPISPADREVVMHAIQEAKRRNPASPESIFEFIGSVLTLDHPEGLSEEQKKDRFQFVLRFQQFTGPVMAKGLEDTAFYRYMPLLSLNEVGGRPDEFGMSRRAFHQTMTVRQKLWPNAISASSTHDTKRSEDVRARINVLSEIPTAWGRAVRRWHKMNAADGKVLDKNEEFMLYQTLVGAWPLDEAGKKDFVKRIQEFLMKALREAKVNSSWFRPNLAYEKAAMDYVERIFDPSSAFVKDIEIFVSGIVRAGLCNALSQMLLKIGCPGVPDFFQGTEMWNLSLVDPDNRRPVDYQKLQQELSALQTAAAKTPPADLVAELLTNITDGRIKLYLVQRALAARNRAPILFQSGTYVPLIAEGASRGNVVAFARHRNEEAVIVMAGRFFKSLEQNGWKDTSIQLPSFMSGWTWRNVFTNRTLQGPDQLLLKDELTPLPFSMLERVSPVA